jgi:hypothetical protein
MPIVAFNSIPVTNETGCQLLFSYFHLPGAETPWVREK